MGKEGAKFGDFDFMTEEDWDKVASSICYLHGEAKANARPGLSIARPICTFFAGHCQRSMQMGMGACSC